MTDSEALEKLKDAVRVRHFSHGTEKSYSLWLRSYMGAVRGYPADWGPEKKIGRFLTGLPAQGAVQLCFGPGVLGPRELRPCSQS